MVMKYTLIEWLVNIVMTNSFILVVLRGYDNKIKMHDKYYNQNFRFKTERVSLS
jgi:hypothetical protein